jgi:hypothetical protein
VYEKESAKGTKYFVGRLGYARITLLPGETAADGTPSWRILLQQADSPKTQRPRNDSPQRPKRQNGSREPDLPDDSLDDLWRAGGVP